MCHVHVACVCHVLCMRILCMVCAYITHAYYAYCACVLCVCNACCVCTLPLFCINDTITYARMVCNLLIHAKYDVIHTFCVNCMYAMRVRNVRYGMHVCMMDVLCM